MQNQEWLNKWKSDFFRNFTDEVDKENDYYDSQFEEGRPSRVWDFMEGLLSEHRKMVVRSCCQQCQNLLELKNEKNVQK